MRSFLSQRRPRHNAKFFADELEIDELATWSRLDSLWGSFPKQTDLVLEHFAFATWHELNGRYPELSKGVVSLFRFYACARLY